MKLLPKVNKTPMIWKYAKTRKQREDLEILHIFGGNNFDPNAPNRGSHGKWQNFHGVICDAMTMSPRILTFSNTCWITIQLQDERVLYCCFFKSNKKEEMGMSWFLFQPKKQLIKMEVGCHFDGKTSIYSNLIVVQKVFGFRVSYHWGGRVSTLANCYPNIFQTNIRPSRLHLQGVYV